ncbi:MAG TPA: hypothetical protein VD838_23085 [Anaeromyxobacteraceae bacterium]|nr:hypothetical protein [Anaeromyxobacteraceae bacterium]
MYGRRTISLADGREAIRPLADDDGYSFDLAFDPTNGLQSGIRCLVEVEEASTCRHCFHEIGGKTEHGERFTFERCCWCSARRTRRELVPGAHGRFGPEGAFG